MARWPALVAMLAVVALALSGCAARDYPAPLLPPFMGEGIASRAADGESTTKDSTPAEEKKAMPEEGAEDAELLPPPRVLGEAGVTLDEAIQATLNVDPKIAAAFETINQAQADLLTSSLLPNPQFLGDGTTLPFQKPTPERTAGPPETDTVLSWSIDWFLFGKRAAAMASGRLGVDVSAADFADMVRQRVAATVAAFYDVLEAEAFADLARVDLDNLKRVESITADRVKLGGVGNIELDRIRLAVFDSQRELRNRERTRAAAKAALRALMGRGDAEPAFAVRGSLATAKPTQPPSAEVMLAVAEDNRPDLISLRRQLVKAEADINNERRKACPSVTPGFGLSRQYQKAAIGSPDASTFDVSLTMSVPVFDRNQGNIRKAQATQSQVAYNLQAQLIALRAEIEQAVNDFRVAFENVSTTDPEQLKAAASVRDRIEAAYKAGGRTLLDVLDAERAYRDTYRNYITGQSSYWHSLHKLNAAVGTQVLR
jgi:cobalt-zinc-cadmium efflux system outer membrane protein